MILINMPLQCGNSTIFVTGIVLGIAIGGLLGYWVFRKSGLKNWKCTYLHWE